MNISQCKVCNSPHRAEIETLYFQGWGGRKIEKYLKDNYGEDISYRTIIRHMQEHVKPRLKEAIEEETTEIYTKMYKEVASNFGLALEALFTMIKTGKKDLENEKATARDKEVAGRNITMAIKEMKELLQLTEEKEGSDDFGLD
jgi:hypothetical protein